VPPATASPASQPLRPPLLRGVSHLAAVALSPVAMWYLMSIVDGPRGWIGASVFASGVILLFGASSLYHFWPKGSPRRHLVRRIDHATIFVFIAGVYTPFCLKLFGDAWGVPILSVIWSLAGVGWVVTVLRPTTSRWVRVALYLGMGWVSVAAIPKLIIGEPWQVFAGVAAAGIAYSVGAFIYGMKRPNFAPAFFGYHEFFHALVVVATGIFYWVIARYVLAA
jgi:hemolysin III